MFSSLAPPRGQTPPDQRGQARAPTTAAAQGPAAARPATPVSFATPNASQRKLSIRKFDGTELYKGLGSGFFNWGRTFLRAVNLAESACGFT